MGTSGATGDLPKVLYCSFDVIPEPSGTSARATEFLRGITPVFNVDGLTAKTPDHSHIVRYHGARLMRVPVGSGDLPSRAQAFERAVRRQLESDEYQLVHFTDPYGGYALCELKPQHNFKLLYEVVGFPSIEIKYTHPHLEGDRRFVARLRRQELFCLMNADAVLVGSQVTAQMVESLGVSRERVFVIPPAVEMSDYPAIPRAREEGAPLRAIYIGNQHSWQGLSTLLFALSAAVKAVDVRLSIVGPVNHEWRLQLDEMIKYRKLGDRVEFLDPVPHAELPKVLAAADVGMAPLEKSERNTQQGAPIMKVAHYLASGMPVIASDLPVMRELLDDDVALFHKPGDEKALAQRLIELAGDPDRRRRMGQRARALALERLLARNAQRRLREIYAGLLGIEVPEPSEDAEPGAESNADADAPTSMVSLDDARLPPLDQHTLIQFQDRAAVAPEPRTDPYARPVAPPAEHTLVQFQPRAPAPEPHTDPSVRPVSSVFEEARSADPGDAPGTDPAIRTPPAIEPEPAAPAVRVEQVAPSAAPPVLAPASAPSRDPELTVPAVRVQQVSASVPPVLAPAEAPAPSSPAEAGEGDASGVIDVTAEAEPLPAPAPAAAEPEEVSEDDIEEAPPAPAPIATPASRPEPSPPVLAVAAPAAEPEPIADDDIVPVPAAEPAQVPAVETAALTTTSSGVSPEEEWFGHLLFGYAPFGVPLHRRVSTGEQPMQLPKTRTADG